MKYMWDFFFKSIWLGGMIWKTHSGVFIIEAEIVAWRYMVPLSLFFNLIS